MAAVDRGFGRWCRASPNIVAFSEDRCEGLLADASIVGVKLSERPADETTAVNAG